MPSLSVPIETSLEIDFECECDECGESLDSEIIEKIGCTIVKVQKCITCSKADVQAGVERGEEAGYESGLWHGHEKGYKEGHADGYESGKDDAEPR